MSAGNTTSARHVTATERQADALKLRRQGNSYTAIGASLEISRQAAHKLVKAALLARAGEIADEAEGLRALEDERLDMAIRAVATQVVAGHLGAIDRWVRLSESRRKLWGLDAPTRAEVTGANGGPLYKVYIGFDPTEV